MSEYSKIEIEKLLNSNNVEAITKALLYLTFNINDFDWVQNTILKLADNLNEDISGLAVTCLGHIARIHSKIDKDRVIPYLKLKAKNKHLLGRIEDALDDIEMFT